MRQGVPNKGLPAIATEPFGPARTGFPIRPARVTLTGSPLFSSGDLLGHALPKIRASLGRYGIFNCTGAFYHFLR